MKKLVLLATSVLFAAVASADVLYWQVSDTPITVGDNSDISYSYARISLDGNYLSSYVGNEITGRDQIKASWFNVGMVAGAVFDGSGIDLATSTFLVELFNAENEMIASATSVGVSDFSSYVDSVSSFDSSWTSMNAWSVSSFTPSSGAIPEPTSGLLFLIGSALLGLRRRKRA